MLSLPEARGVCLGAGMFALDAIAGRKLFAEPLRGLLRQKSDAG